MKVSIECNTHFSNTVFLIQQYVYKLIEMNQCVKPITMNKLLLIVLLGLFVSSCQQPSVQTASNAVLKFEQQNHNFGVLDYEVPGSYAFNFENTGNSPLIIHNVKASCGCTEPVWDKKPIKPGKSGSITVTYDSKSTGRFLKDIVVFYNGPNSPDTLVVSGEVAYCENNAL
jgi:hypothetical protein